MMNPAPWQNRRAATPTVLGLAGITLYWTFTYSGPYRYLAELQIKWFGSYIPKLTALMVIVGLLGIGQAIKFVLKGAERLVPGTPVATVPTPGASTAASEPWLRYFRYAVLLLPFGLGGWAYYNGTLAGGLQQLNAVDFQSGRLQARVVYADVRGHLSGMYLAKDKYLYIPMSSEENMTGLVHLLVGVNENEMKKYLHREADGTFRVRGVADKGLEGDLKHAFEKNGIAVADPVWIVHTGREPAGDRQLGLIMMGLGIAFAGFIFGLESYKRRKSAVARPLEVAA
jgi:hypothetical protein